MSSPLSIVYVRDNLHLLRRCCHLNHLLVAGAVPARTTTVSSLRRLEEFDTAASRPGSLEPSLRLQAPKDLLCLRRVCSRVHAALTGRRNIHH